MKLKLNTDRIIGLSAMLISLLTFIIFIYQTDIIRTQSRLSVAPRLDFAFVLDGEDDSTYTFKVLLANKGLGPAIIESANIIYDGKKQGGDFYRFINETISKRKSFEKLEEIGALSKGDVLQSNESIVLYAIKFENSKLDEIIKYYKKEYGRVVMDVEIAYSSMYNEKWVVRQNDKGHPVELE